MWPFVVVIIDERFKAVESWVCCSERPVESLDFSERGGLSYASEYVLYPSVFAEDREAGFLSFGCVVLCSVVCDDLSGLAVVVNDRFELSEDVFCRSPFEQLDSQDVSRTVVDEC